jgi:hypothetical protein
MPASPRPPSAPELPLYPPPPPELLALLLKEPRAAPELLAAASAPEAPLEPLPPESEPVMLASFSEPVEDPPEPPRAPSTEMQTHAAIRAPLARIRPTRSAATEPSSTRAGQRAFRQCGMDGTRFRLHGAKRNEGKNRVTDNGSSAR